MASCSLCITNERLSAVVGTANGGRVRLKSFAAAALPEGALINGVITDERLLTQALGVLCESLPKNALRDVRIAIRTSQISTKRMTVPALPRKKLITWVADTFSDVAGGEEMLYDYMPLEHDKVSGGQVALLCAAQKPMIESLVKYFEAQGVSIDSIDTALSAQIKLVRLLKETRGETFILLTMDGAGMDASLFVGGSFRFANSVRLLAERGTPESVAEISRQVSSIIQFNASERSGQNIAHVYAAGLRTDEDRLLSALEGTYGIEAGPLTDEAGCIVSPPESKLPLADYSLAVGNLID